ncbi:uncharacterized protein LOC110989521 isoform X2 [Acanthaster planci]|nr:uncharacterized protein LOC110989521 isoform X2 [Acanthaster planci]XP_022109658.1 uncharacterized protein LOC110989521 isoform X2 [Acanthaster planci]XP_022109659.1 uncharacterized protein LOC110989521 isoform X2 [Acanthaster planci]XP_022109660.1 uncharacterized protein LOC110989521 isoform X3 [Acanthaster planci]XP_022109661.1 uncharacterized protein LOC110989521 isoform X2 [Acanthaster planci]XP_022109662.1 uncharacterized protein LOC110989521 isoform X2 [Acanthaster planci]
MESFYFSLSVPVSHLLMDGLTITNKTDFAIFLAGLTIAAFVLESLKRISRKCLRKVPKPSRVEITGDGNSTQLKRCRSDKAPLIKYIENEAKTQGKEKASFHEIDEKNGNILVEMKVNNETSCCPEECGGAREVEQGDNETEILADRVTCCQDELTEEQETARLEKMWKSLSLEVLNDRWAIFQTKCGEQKEIKGRVTRGYRVVFHVLQTLINMSEITIAYVLMLIVMTYNAWFLICIVGGTGLGYLLLSSDLETLYADYAEGYIKRKVAEEDARRKTCPSTSGRCRKPSKKKTPWVQKQETYC